MTHFALSIIAFVITIGVLVSFHEFGHFWVARRFGIKVLRFSVGFGKPLAVFHGAAPDRTEYCVAAIPLGGYVKLLDEREAPVAEADQGRAFNRQSPPKRIAVMLAGPGFNFLFAILAYWIVFLVGVPAIKPYVGDVAPESIAATAGMRAQDEIVRVDGSPTPTWEAATLRMLDTMLVQGQIPMTVVGPDGQERRVVLDVEGRESALTSPNGLFSGLGIVRGLVFPPVIGAVEAGGPAALAGLEKGDRVRSVNGQRVSSFEVLGSVIGKAAPGDILQFEVQRGGQTVQLPVTVEKMELNGKMGAGIGVRSSSEVPDDWSMLAAKLRTEQQYGVIPALQHGVAKTWEMSSMTVRMMGEMFVGDVSVKNLSGPIAIASLAGDSAQAGLGAFLSFLAIVSVSLGVLNLLPIPLLDGGQIVYQLVEWVKGSPLSERAMGISQQVGIGLLVVLMGFVFYNDLTRVFG